MSLQNDAENLLTFFGRGLPVGSAFLALFKFIEESPNGRFGWLPLGEKAVLGVECDGEIDRFDSALRSSINDDRALKLYGEIANIGADLQAIAKGSGISADMSKRLVIALRVIDAAFRGVHPAEVAIDSDDDGFAKLRTQVRLGEPLFSADGLEVYPKPRRLASMNFRGQRRLTDFLDNLCVISQTPLLKVVYGCDFASAPRGFCRIGIIPTVNTHEELDWTKEEYARYSVQVRAECEAEIRDRVCRGLDLLLDARAELILMPELVSAPSLRTAVSDELRKRSARGLFTPHLILSGTQLTSDAGHRIRNRATVFDNEGELSWEQDKLHAYRFSATEQSDAGHPLGLIDLVDRIEAIDVEPRTLHVVDFSPTQRLVVLTCEDFVQPDPHRAAIADIVATTILVPIMAGRRRDSETGWIQDAALNYVRHPGATSVVANSGTLLGGAADGWQFGHIVSASRVRADWQPLGGPPAIAWLAELPHLV